MRILFLAWRDVAHPQAGGSEVLVDHLAGGLHDRGHEVVLLASGPLAAHEYQTCEAGGRLSQYLRDPLTARRLGRFDVIVDVGNGVPFFTPLWTRTPTVLLVNHIHFGMWREWFSAPVSLLGSTIETKVMPQLYRNGPVVAVSESTARALQGIGIPRQRIHVVHNGVELAGVGARSASRAAEPTFLAVGRLVPHKRFDLLLRAWSKVHPEVGGRLLIVGEGHERPNLAAMLPEGAELLGFVSEDEKRRLMEEAWLLVQPSRLEGWGLVVMEAAAAGTPTLGFWSPGTRDAVEHGDTGVLVRTEAELIEEWIRLARDDEARRVLSKAAIERALHFSWERTVDDFERVLLGAAASPRGFALDPDDARPAAPPRRPKGTPWRTKVELLGLFLREKHEPGPFYSRLADDWVGSIPYRVDGRRILDLGSGTGEMAAALRRAGADVVAVDLDLAPVGATDPSVGRSCADGARLPFRDATFDGVVCSNMLEHTPDPAAILHEVARVLAPGGWSWVSWTNWYSPWGGHEIVPFHYLGPRLGLRAWRRLFGEVRTNVPFDGLWPTYISQVLQMVDREAAFEVRDVFPRYYPSQRWITRIPVLRELATWNCVLMLERRPNVALEPEPPLILGEPGVRAAVRRSLRWVRERLGDNPRYLPLLLRATPLGTTRRITSETELVIEGFPRSGNTFAHFAVLHAEPGAVVTSRVHAPAQVKAAVRQSTPVLITVREPLATIASAAVAAEHVPIRSLLLEYIHHYRQVVPLLDRVVIATFDDITTDFGAVMRALNERFGLGFREFRHTAVGEAEVFASIARHHHAHHGEDESSLPLPVASQRRRKERIKEEVLRPEYAALLQEAQTVYETLAARSGVVTAPARRTPVMADA
jgi:glycosyltransferase involved in cell wall biosynthesis/SAM-dependent methyltransferase